MSQIIEKGPRAQVKGRGAQRRVAALVTAREMVHGYDQKKDRPPYRHPWLYQGQVFGLLVLDSFFL